MARPKGSTNSPNCRKRGTVGKYIKYDKDRECLRCEKMFPSSGPENRICYKCRGKNVKMEEEMKYGEVHEVLINKRWVAGG